MKPLLKLTIKEATAKFERFVIIRPASLIWLVFEQKYFYKSVQESFHNFLRRRNIKIIYNEAEA